MKFIHLVPVLGVAAALGAAQALPSRSSHALAAPPPQASVVPPWLVEPAGGEPAEGVHVHAGDPHAGEAGGDYHDVHVHAADPHAGLAYDPHANDPHAAAHETACAAGCGGDDPHADPCAGGCSADDPHAGVCAAGCGADPHADDPHAGVYPALGPGIDEEDPYERVGLAPTPEVSVAAVERSRAANGHSVAEVYSSREKLAGQTLRVRGTVVKLNEGILGQTYLHLRDGSGDPDRGDDDLTVTTTEPFQLGETVEVSGELAIDRDVGAGYVYAALLTKATRVAQ